MDAQARIEWVETRICTYFGSKIGQRVVDFLERDEIAALFVVQDGQNSLMASHTPPASIWQSSAFANSVYFLKIGAQAKSVEELSTSITCGSLTANTLFDTWGLLYQVMYGLVSNPRNHGPLGSQVASEIRDNVETLASQCAIVSGHGVGEAVLPIPPLPTIMRVTEDHPGSPTDRVPGGGEKGAALGDGDGADESAGAGAGGGPGSPFHRHSPPRSFKDDAFMLEQSVVTWTRQLRYVLTLNPEGVFRDGVKPSSRLELDFWKRKARYLHSLWLQMQSGEMDKVVNALDLCHSQVLPEFQYLRGLIEGQRVEAIDCVKFLSTLEAPIAALAEHDFEVLEDRFLRLHHTMFMIWQHSKAYTEPHRLDTFVRVVCIELIERAQKYVNGKTILAMDPDDAIENLLTSIRVCTAFEEGYVAVRAKAGAELTEDETENLFERLHAYVERCVDVLSLTRTSVMFSRLETVEIGGTKGKPLTATCRTIHADMIEAMAPFRAIGYDVLDMSSTQFDDDFMLWGDIAHELLLRVGSVVSQGVIDAAGAGVGRMCKVLELFGPFLAVEDIQTTLERRQRDVVAAYIAELAQTKSLFLTNKDHPPLNDNVPEIAGSVEWARALKQRATSNLPVLNQVCGRIMNFDAMGAEVTAAHDEFVDMLLRYETDRVSSWATNAALETSDKLGQSLLAPTNDGSHGGFGLGVNFDFALTALLRETRYLLRLGIAIPDAALAIYRRGETFRQQSGNLELIVRMYHRVVDTIEPVERPMLQSRLDVIEKALQKGVKELSWSGTGVAEFVQQTMGVVKEAVSILDTIKANVKATSAALAFGSDRLLFDRPPQITSAEALHMSHATLQQQRQSELVHAGETVLALLQSSNKALRASKGSPAWQSYVDHVSGVVVRSLRNLAVRSAERIARCLDPKDISSREVQPIEVRLELVDGKIIFVPPLKAAPLDPLASGFGGGAGGGSLLSPWVGSGGGTTGWNTPSASARGVGVGGPGLGGGGGGGGPIGGAVGGMPHSPGPSRRRGSLMPLITDDSHGKIVRRGSLTRRKGLSLVTEGNADVNTSMALRTMAERWVSCCVSATALIPRLDHGDGDYLLDIEEDLELRAAVASVHDQLDATETQAFEFQSLFQEFSHLWIHDSAEKFKAFLSTGRDGREPPLAAIGITSIF